jgi:hypothetical protein
MRVRRTVALARPAPLGFDMDVDVVGDDLFRTAHLSLTSDIASRANGKQHARLSVAEAAGLAAWLHADLA